MKIHIFYRHFNIENTDNRGRPEWFDFEKCFVNLLSTIENEEVVLHVVMDGDINTNFIGKYADKYVLHTIEAGTDASSFFQTWAIASSIKMDDKDLYYFLENDYLHQPGWVAKVQEMFTTFGHPPHYISLYDHNDKYFLPMYSDLVSKIYTTPTHHWRTTPSTCGSFIVGKHVFREDYDINSTMVGDHNKFIHLSKERDRGVLTPLPGLSTHCMQGLLSPTISWENYSK